MSFVAVIPARYASTRFPGKPLIDLFGKPMIVRVAERAALSSATRVIVATDDARIANACRAVNLDVAMTRADHSTGTDRLSEVVTALGLDDHTIVVNVQGDEPNIPPSAIDAVAAMLDADPTAAMATLCHPIHDIADVTNPNVVKCIVGEGGNALYFSRAPVPFARDAWAAGMSAVPQGLPVYRHIGLYAYRASFLRAFPNLSVPAIERHEALEQLRALAHGYRIRVAVVNDPLPPGIDTPEDYARLLALHDAN